MTADGTSIPEKALIEHNMQALAKLYYNIYMNDAAKIFRLDAFQMEKVPTIYLT